MYVPILINWTSPYPILELLSVFFFNFYFNFKTLLFENSIENLIRRHICDVCSGIAMFADLPPKGRYAYNIWVNP